MSQTAIYRSNRPYDAAAFDGLLAGVIAAIVLLGLVMVFSAGVSGNIGQFELRISHLLKHSVHILAGVGLMFLVVYVNLDALQAKSKLLLLAGMLALAALLLPGVGLDINGSTRWFSIAGVRVQPAELMKLICLIYVADYYSRKQNSVHLFKVGVLNLALPIVAVGVLLLLQPDFGTLVVIVATTGGLMFLAGVRFGYFVAAIVLALMALAMIALLEPYRVERLLTYQNPWAEIFS